MSEILVFLIVVFLGFICLLIVGLYFTSIIADGIYEGFKKLYEEYHRQNEDGIITLTFQDGETFTYDTSKHKEVK